MSEWPCTGARAARLPLPAARARAPAAPGARPGAGSELLEVLGAFSGHFCSRFPDPRPVPTRRPSQHAERSSGSKPAMAPIRRDRRDRSRWTIAKDLRGRRAKVGHLAMGCNTVLVHARARRSPGPAPRPGAARTMDKNHLFCPDATHFQQDLLRKRASRASDPDSFFTLSNQKLYEF